MKKPLKKMAPTMKTLPATMPIQAATAFSRLCRRAGTTGSATVATGAAGGAEGSIGPVSGSDDGVSLMFSIMRGAL
jgi:hypothetical protein